MKHKHHESVALGTFDQGALLRLAASLEKASEHPLAEAIVKGAEARGIALPAPEDFEAISGQGIKGHVDGARYGPPDAKPWHRHLRCAAAA